MVAKISDADMCSVSNDDCTSGVHARGYCRRHYQQWYAHGDPLHPPKKVFNKPLPPCRLFDECGNTTRSHATDVCETHQKRAAKWGDASYRTNAPDGHWDGALCSHDDCSNPVSCKGKCKNHYWSEKIADKRCSVDGCDRRMRRRGLCGSHADNGPDYVIRNCPTGATHLYLMVRPGEMQLGKTRSPKVRIGRHALDGWVLVDLLSSADADAVELRLRRWLRANVGTLPGRLENWSTADLEVSSLAELFARAGVSP
jgi:hypothetical protein